MPGTASLKADPRTRSAFENRHEPIAVGVRYETRLRKETNTIVQMARKTHGTTERKRYGAVDDLSRTDRHPAVDKRQRLDNEHGTQLQIDG